MSTHSICPNCGAMGMNCRLHENAQQLLDACKKAYQELDLVYDVDEPEPGYHKEHPFSGAGQLMDILLAAIDAAEGR